MNHTWKFYCAWLAGHLLVGIMFGAGLMLLAWVLLASMWVVFISVLGYGIWKIHRDGARIT